MCIANKEGFFLDVNPSFSRVLGYSSEELKARQFIEFVHPEDIEITNQQMTILSDGDIVQGFYNRYKHADGHFITLKWSAYANNEANKIYAIASDITIQQKTQQKLDQIEKALQAETIIVMTDHKGIITEVNHKFCEISGYTKSELIGQTLQLINANHHSKHFFEELWQTIKSGKIWTGTIQNRRKNGEVYFVKSVITPIFNGTSDQSNFLAIQQDVTENIQFAAELSRVLEILNETGAIAKVGGWELDIASGELTWTDETFKILEVEKLSGQKPILPEGLKLFVPEHQPIIENAVNRAIEFGEPYGLELMAMTAKGNKLWVFTNGKPNYKNGEIATLSGTIQDIHARKAAQFKYENERQRSIHNAKLASLGELAASVAHEINNPLGIISGYAEMLEESFPKEHQIQSKLGAISRSVDRIAHIVRSLKKYSQTDSKKEFAPICLNSVFEESLTLVGPKLKRHDIQLDTNMTSTARVLGNDIELEQVLINLLNNALDAIKNSDVKWIKVCLKQNNHRVKLTITDSGNGIAPPLIRRIFEPFYTTKANGEGTGLGLSIVQGILMEHGATIHVDTQSPNTSLVLEFPCYEE